MYSIVIPYLKSSKYIDQCKHYLEKNSAFEYELIEVVDETDVYYAFNKGVYQAKFDKVILMNDDMIVSKDWDVNFVKYITEDTFVTCHVVEPSPGVNYRPDGTTISNIKCDCGQVDNFDYDKFEKFIGMFSVPEVIQNSKGWYMPFGVHKKSFVSYPNREKFPLPNDVLLIDYILPNCGYKFAQVRSFVYHYQCGSQK